MSHLSHPPCNKSLVSGKCIGRGGYAGPGGAARLPKRNVGHLAPRAGGLLGSGNDWGVRGEPDPAPEPLSDSDLLVAARRDPEAFGELYDRWVARVTGYFFRRTACPHTAADLAAETFAAAYQQRRRFDPAKGRPDAWIFGVARNQLGHFMRRRSVDDRARRRLGMARVEIDDDHADSIASRADAQELFDAVRAAMSTLSPAVREAVELRVALDLGYEEVAERLGCSVGAARVRVTRGLSQLHDLVGIER